MEDDVTELNPAEFGFLLLINQERDEDRTISEIRQDFETAIGLFEAGELNRLN